MRRGVQPRRGEKRRFRLFRPPKAAKQRRTAPHAREEPPVTTEAARPQEAARPWERRSKMQRFQKPTQLASAPPAAAPPSDGFDDDDEQLLAPAPAATALLPDADANVSDGDFATRDTPATPAAEVCNPPPPALEAPATPPPFSRGWAAPAVPTAPPSPVAPPAPARGRAPRGPPAQRRSPLALDAPRSRPSRRRDLEIARPPRPSPVAPAPPRHAQQRRAPPRRAPSAQSRDPPPSDASRPRLRTAAVEVVAALPAAAAPPQLAPPLGTRVVVGFEDGDVEGTIRKVLSNSTVEVQYDDGPKTVIRFPNPDVRILSAAPAPPPRAGGDAVAPPPPPSPPCLPVDVAVFLGRWAEANVHDEFLLYELGQALEIENVGACESAADLASALNLDSWPEDLCERLLRAWCERRGQAYSESASVEEDDESVKEESVPEDSSDDEMDYASDGSDKDAAEADSLLGGFTARPSKAPASRPPTKARPSKAPASTARRGAEARRGNSARTGCNSSDSDVDMGSDEPTAEPRDDDGSTETFDVHKIHNLVVEPQPPPSGPPRVWEPSDESRLERTPLTPKRLRIAGNGMKLLRKRVAAHKTLEIEDADGVLVLAFKNETSARFRSPGLTTYKSAKKMVQRLEDGPSGEMSELRRIQLHRARLKVLAKKAGYTGVIEDVGAISIETQQGIFKAWKDKFDEHGTTTRVRIDDVVYAVRLVGTEDKQHINFTEDSKYAKQRAYSQAKHVLECRAAGKPTGHGRGLDLRKGSRAVEAMNSPLGVEIRKILEEEEDPRKAAACLLERCPDQVPIEVLEARLARLHPESWDYHAHKSTITFLRAEKVAGNDGEGTHGMGEFLTFEQAFVYIPNKDEDAASILFEISLRDMEKTIANPMGGCYRPLRRPTLMEVCPDALDDGLRKVASKVDVIGTHRGPDKKFLKKNMPEDADDVEVVDLVDIMCVLCGLDSHGRPRHGHPMAIAEATHSISMSCTFLTQTLGNDLRDLKTGELCSKMRHQARVDAQISLTCCMRLCAARDHQLAGNRYGFPPLEKYEPSARYHQELEKRKSRDKRKRARSKPESEEEVVASRPKRRARAKK